MLPNNLLTKYGTVLFLYFQIHQFQSILDNDSQLHQFFFKAKEPNYLVPAVGQNNLSLSQCPGTNHPGMEAESFNFCNLGVCKHH